MAEVLSLNHVLADVTREGLLELAASLIAVPSVGGEELRVMEVARAWLEARGVSVEVVARDPQRPNLVATVGKGRSVLALNGHLDTVPVADRVSWLTDPHEPTVVDDRLYGLGALDMKSCVAVMMVVAAQLQKHAERLRSSLQLQIVSDEEDGCYYGTIYIVEEIKAGRLPRPDMMLMAENSNLKLIHAERGTFKFTVTFHGKSTHTATARVDGVNPILHAAHAVIALERDLPRYDPQIGYGVISVNMINAGKFMSQVPDECRLLVDRRMLPGETDESCLADAEREIRESLKDHPEARFEVAHWVDRNGRRRYSPPNVTPWESRVVQAVARAHKRVTGEDAQPFVDWYGATDGRLFRYEGIETVNYGPSGAHAHGANEYVEIPSLMTQLRVFLTAALDLLT